MPRITAGGPESPDAIKRVDITPEDIRGMEDHELMDLLARIRSQRETSAPRTSRAKSERAPSQPSLPQDDTMEDME